MALPENTTLEGGRKSAAPGRRAWVDVARGVAVLGMVVYHTAWDLSELALIRTAVSASPAWSGLARTVAASFLFLVGVGLVLAHGDGLNRRAFVGRLAIVAVAAVAITAATLAVVPDAFIFFGILHNIAVSSLVALPFVRAPALLPALAAAAVFAAPLWFSSPVFDAAPLLWVGLGTVVPDTNDYVPLLPWSGFVLAGIAAARLLPVPAWPARGPVLAGLAAIGRRSLVIYLLHQPLIFGSLWLYGEVVGPDPVAEAAPFVSRCTAGCREVGTEEAVCRRSCECTVAGLKREDRWSRIAAGRQTPEDAERASALAGECFAASR